MADKSGFCFTFSTCELTLITGVSDFLRSGIFSSSCFKRFFLWKKEKRFLFLKQARENKVR